MAGNPPQQPWEAPGSRREGKRPNNNQPTNSFHNPLPSYDNAYDDDLFFTAPFQGQNQFGIGQAGPSNHGWGGQIGPSQSAEDTTFQAQLRDTNSMLYAQEPALLQDPSQLPSGNYDNALQQLQSQQRYNIQNNPPQIFSGQQNALQPSGWGQNTGQPIRTFQQSSYAHNYNSGATFQAYQGTSQQPFQAQQRRFNSAFQGDQGPSNLPPQAQQGLSNLPPQAHQGPLNPQFQTHQGSFNQPLQPHLHAAFQNPNNINPLSQNSGYQYNTGPIRQTQGLPGQGQGQVQGSRQFLPNALSPTSGGHPTHGSPFTGTAGFQPNRSSSSQNVPQYQRGSHRPTPFQPSLPNAQAGGSVQQLQLNYPQGAANRPAYADTAPYVERPLTQPPQPPHNTQAHRTTPQVSFSDRKDNLLAVVAAGATRDAVNKCETQCHKFAKKANLESLMTCYEILYDHGLAERKDLVIALAQNTRYQHEILKWIDDFDHDQEERQAQLMATRRASGSGATRARSTRQSRAQATYPDDEQEEDNDDHDNEVDFDEPPASQPRSRKRKVSSYPPRPRAGRNHPPQLLAPALLKRPVVDPQNPPPEACGKSTPREIELYARDGAPYLCNLCGSFFKKPNEVRQHFQGPSIKRAEEGCWHRHGRPAHARWNDHPSVNFDVSALNVIRLGERGPFMFGDQASLDVVEHAARLGHSTKRDPDAMRAIRLAAQSGQNVEAYAGQQEESDLQQDEQSNEVLRSLLEQASAPQPPTSQQHEIQQPPPGESNVEHFGLQQHGLGASSAQPPPFQQASMQRPVQELNLQQHSTQALTGQESAVQHDQGQVTVHQDPSVQQLADQRQGAEGASQPAQKTQSASTAATEPNDTTSNTETFDPQLLDPSTWESEWESEFVANPTAQEQSDPNSSNVNTWEIERDPTVAPPAPETLQEQAPAIPVTESQDTGLQTASSAEGFGGLEGAPDANATGDLLEENGVMHDANSFDELYEDLQYSRQFP